MLEFDLSKCSPLKGIIKVELNIFIKKGIENCSCSNIDIFRILEPYYENIVTWDNNPSTKETEDSIYIHPCLENQYVKTDITRLALGWITGNIPNYGLELVARKGDNKIVLGSSKSINNNYITIYYDESSFITGPTGPTGSTPVIGTNGNWFINDIDTGSPSKGVTGATGATPLIGANGNWFINDVDTGSPSKGVTGTTGATPVIGPNGNWFINGIDTSSPSQGVTGPKGVTGSATTFTNFFSSNATNQDILPSASVAFTQDTSIGGTDITHVAGSTDIILAGGHTYQVLVAINVAQAKVFNISPHLNGVSLSNTIVSQHPAFNSGTTFIFVKTPAGQTSTLTMTSNATVDTMTQANVSISVMEIA